LEDIKMNSLKLLVLTIAVVAILAGCGGTDEAETTRAGQDAPAGEVKDPHEGHAHDASPQVAVATCGVHGADAALCYFCDASLRDPSRLWCKEHNRYEDRCLICHPEIRDKSRLYCTEHGLYEDECFICHPELFEAKDDDNNDGASTGPGTEVMMAAAAVTSGLHCNEHDVAESECGICHPELADLLAPGGGLKIRFPSTTSAAKAGIESSHPTRENAPRTVSAVGELGYNLNRLVRVTPLVDGVVREVHADLGDEVEAGQALVSIASPHIADAKAAYLEAVAEETVAMRALERDTKLFEKDAIAEQRLIEAQAKLATTAAHRGAAEQNLIDLGFTSGEVARVKKGESGGSGAVLRAPFAATVVGRNAVRGDVVSVGTELLQLADTKELWLNIAVPERDVAGVAPNQRVTVRSEATGLETSGLVSWVSTHLNETTRMAEVRAVIPDPGGLWKAGMFVSASILLDTTGDALSVSAGSVHRFGGLPFVFVEVGDGLYEVRRIDLLGANGDRAYVAAGLTADERVVTSRSFLVKSEFQKSRLGAGCVD
jgi:cobalt-zinc-cadmium efflux system membrane fusion protein